MNKFRGKRIDNGEWVYGYFLYRKGGTSETAELISPAHLIYDGRVSFEVHPDSIGMWTGEKVKNEVEMYGGDIISVINPKCQRQKKRLIGTVIFSYTSFGFKLAKVDVWEHYSVEAPEIGEIYWFLNIADFATIEVIGNITDNKELLEV